MSLLPDTSTSFESRFCCNFSISSVVGMVSRPSYNDERSRRLATKLPNLIELASVTGHWEVNMLERCYKIITEELATKLA
ncbi:hypothetical protein ALP10_200152 [Pseudomonas syringae pv. helianthi]|uniref:Uncharacterized protein n=2 Tax=Pseudomonas TaxID=286 RepID=A0A3M6CN79_9PSED|nr:hypothetical protein ALP10_200152 [Pseudomonas syringae pv. helianthi]